MLRDRQRVFVAGFYHHHMMVRVAASPSTLPVETSGRLRRQSRAEAMGPLHHNLNGLGWVKCPLGFHYFKPTFDRFLDID